MKIRTDFVTNSSSSSFILATKDELDINQIQALQKFIVEHYLGQIVLTPESSEEDIAYVIEEYSFQKFEKKIRRALKAGKSIRTDFIDFADSVEGLIDMYQNLWSTLEKANKKNFQIIDDDLNY